MIRAAIIYATLAAPALAEGRNDPFYKCTFDDGREVILAEQGEGFEWREGSFIAPLASEPRFIDDPIISFMGIWGDPERIDVFVGWQLGSGPELEIGSAMLSRTVINDAGVMTTLSTNGLCEDYFG